MIGDLRRKEKLESEVKIKEKLRVLLREYEISQTEFSSITQVNKSTIHGYLQGILPKGVISLIKIAQTFNLSLDELVYGNEKAS